MTYKRVVIINPKSMSASANRLQKSLQERLNIPVLKVNKIGRAHV